MAALAVVMAALAGPNPALALGPQVEADRPVQFVDRSIFAPETWAWDFDYNGGTPTIDSTEQNPVWKFRMVGTHQVRLEVCNVLGCGVRIQEIQVVTSPLFFEDFERGDFSTWATGLGQLP